jgi:hypothetical protein
VDVHQYVFVAAWGGMKRSYGVETPHGKGHDGGMVRRT